MTIRVEYKTPGTRLWWGDLRDWVNCAIQLTKRRSCEATHKALWSHVAAMPLDLVKVETDIEAIRVAIDLLIGGPKYLARPERGHRAEAPHTPLLMELKNRLKVLERDAELGEPGDNWRAVHDIQAPPN